MNAVPSVTLDISRSCNRAISNSALEYSQTPYCSSLSDLTDRLDSNAMPIVKSIFQSLNKRFQIEILDRNTQGLFLLPADGFKLRAVHVSNPASACHPCR